MSRLIAATDLCELAIGLLLVEVDANGPWIVHLFKNNYVPVRATDLADLTEADVTDYAAQDVGVFTGPTDLGNQVWSMDAPENTFTLDGSVTPQTIYGYYVTNNAEDSLLWSERFDEPRVVDEAAFVIVVRPQLTTRSLFGM